MARKIIYEVSINDPKAEARATKFALAVPDDLPDDAIQDEVRRHALAHAVNIVWRKVDFLP